MIRTDQHGNPEIRNRYLRTLAHMLGHAKVWQGRLSQYVSLINFIMLFYLFVIDNDWFSWYVWLFIITSLIALVVMTDTLIILPISQRYLTKKNPAMQEIAHTTKENRRELQRIRKILEEKNEDLFPRD